MRPRLRLPNRRVLLIALVLASAIACTQRSTVNLSPQGHRALAADQIAQRVGELQNLAITEEANHQLPTATARVIVQFCVTAAPTLKATPEGWLAMVQSGWRSAKAQLSPITNPAITAALAAVDLALGGLQ